MNKVLFLSIVTLFFLSSCQKEIIIEPSLVFTDEPPRELWGPNEVYKQTLEGFLTKKEIQEVEKRGYYCNYWYDQSGNIWNAYDCGNYYIIPVHQYYGIFKGKMYISKARKMASIYGNLLLDAQEIIQRKETVIVQLYPNQQNPVGAFNTVAGMIR